MRAICRRKTSHCLMVNIQIWFFPYRCWGLWKKRLKLPLRSSSCNKSYKKKTKKPQPFWLESILSLKQNFCSKTEIGGNRIVINPMLSNSGAMLMSQVKASSLKSTITKNWHWFSHKQACSHSHHLTMKTQKITVAPKHRSFEILTHLS